MSIPKVILSTLVVPAIIILGIYYGVEQMLTRHMVEVPQIQLVPKR